MSRNLLDTLHLLKELIDKDCPNMGDREMVEVQMHFSRLKERVGFHRCKLLDDIVR